MLALIVPPCVLTAAAAPAPPAAPSAVMSADASSGEATMTSDSSAYSLPDVTVTNAKDKEMQLPKILKLDESVKEAMIDGAKFLSRATIDLDHERE